MTQLKKIFLLFVLCAISVPVVSAYDYDVPSSTKITASDAAAGDTFSIRVEIEGDLAIVGAYYEGDPADLPTDAGAAYIYQKIGGVWTQVKKLEASDATTSDWLGLDVAISADYALVGAYGDNTYGSLSGAAYIFERNLGGVDNWGERKKLLASDGDWDDRFGNSVGISGTYLLIGAPNHDGIATTDGAVYVFERDAGGANNWGEVKEINPSDAASPRQFGTEMDIDGDRMIVGGPTLGHGHAYIFEKDLGGGGNWGERKILTAPDGADADRFGTGLSILGNYAFVGAPYDDDLFSASGSVYVYEKDLGGVDNWGFRKKINTGDPAFNDRFGSRIAADTTQIYVASSNDDDGTDSGAAYVFQRDLGGLNNWGERTKLTAQDAAAGDSFGDQLHISGNDLILSAWGDDDYGANSGAAYILDVTTIALPPTVPSDFSAHSFNGSTATLEWTDNSSSETNFNVYYATSDSQPGVASYTPAANATSQPVTGLSATLPNYFWLTSENGAGESSAQKICLKWAGAVNKIRKCDSTTGDGFAMDIDIDGNFAVVGEYQDDDKGLQSGSAFIFRKNGDTWAEVKKVTASDGAANDWFGTDVVISGNYVLISAPQDNTNRGAAYLYEKDYGGLDNWGQVKKIIASDGTSYDRFGDGIDIDGNTIVIGSGGDDDLGSASGSAYIYTKDFGGTNNWGQFKKIKPSDGAASDAFGGASVSISGNLIVIGSDNNDDGGTNSGSAYIFEKDFGGADNWGERKKIVASDAAGYDRFGYSSGIDGNFVVIGTYDANAAYVFEKDFGGADNWGQRKILLSKDTITSDEFSWDVAVSGNYVTVGAWSDDDFYTNAGSLWVFEKDQGGTDNWGVYAKILASDATYEQLGVSVAMSGNNVVGAANFDDNIGSGYVFDLTTLTAPTAPSDIYMSSYGGTFGTINWTDNSSTEFNYYVYRSNTTTKPDVPSYVMSANSTSQSVSGLSTTLPNYLWVTAIGQRETNNPPVCIKYSAVVGKMLPCDGAADDYFGQIIDISGNYAVVGAPDDDDNGVNSGSAYIFRRSGITWTQIKKLSPSDSAADYNFGKSVTISGSYAIVGSDNADGSGMTFVFEKDFGGADNWGERKKLVASDAAASDLFGAVVDLSGNYAIISAESNDDAGSASGSAYVFEKDFGGADNWGERKKLVASDAATGDAFSTSLTIDGTMAAVGAPGDSSASGSAYVFEKDFGGADNWGERKKITASDIATGDEFAGAGSLSISGTFIAAGASLNDDAGSASGSAYVFEKDLGGADNWGERTKLTADDATGGDNFGSGIALEGTSVLVGAVGDDDNGADSGSFYIYSKDTGGADNWGQLGKASSADGATGDLFGISIALDSGYIVVGAKNDDDSGNNSGSAYSYDLGAFAPPNEPSTFYGTDFNGATATLNWTDNSSDEANFNIYYATTVVQPGSPSYTPAADATSQAVAGLSATLPNYFWLTAKNGFGESAITSICLRYSATTDKILPCDGQADDYFGHAVDIQGNYAVVGAWQDDDNGSDAGAVYVFRKSGTTWTQIKKLVGSDTSGTDNFGTSVSVLNDRIFVGAPGVDDVGSDSGAVYVFSRNQGGTDNWGEVKKITASDQASGDSFGESISSVWDDGIYKLMVGAPNNDDGGADSGSVYFHNQNTGGAENWGEVQKVVASNAAAGDNFGKSVDISTTHAVVGAWQTDGAGVNSGSAYILYDTIGWIEVTEITASDTSASDNFGHSVSIDGNSHVMVGAPYHSSAEGAAYIYGKDQGGADNWGELKKIVADDATSGDRLGWSVTTQGIYAIAGAYLKDENGADSGATYLFKQNEGGADNWGQVEKITPSDNATDDYFGFATALSGTDLIVGAQKDDEDAVNSGSTYYYDVSTFGATPKVYDSASAVWEDFGYSVDIDGSFAIVGKPNYSTWTIGDVFIYKKNATTSLWEEKWTVAGGGATEFIGSGVALSGDYAVIGIPGINPATGRVEVYKRITDTNWSLVDTLVPSDSSSNDRFGYSVDIDGDYIVLGSRAEKAYVFQRDAGFDTWSEVIILTASDAFAGQVFGISVAINLPNVIVGANYSSGDGTGAAYIFNKDQGGVDNWGEIQKFTDNNPGRADYFGAAVAINGSYAIVGAPQYDDWDGAGRVHIFKETAGVWAETANMQASDPTSWVNFGQSVDITGDYAVVGAPWANGIASNSEGKAYVFKRDTGLETWTETQTLTASDGLNGDQLGCSIAITETAGNYDIIVGAQSANGAANDAGAAYFYNFTDVAPPAASSGGGSSDRICTVIPTQLNLPRDLDVFEQDGKSVVELNWGDSRIHDAEASKKIEVLFDYLNQNPAPQLDSTGKPLAGILTRHLYNRIYESEDTALIENFETHLKRVVQMEEKATLNLLEAVGINYKNDYFSEWWPYLFIEKLQGNRQVGEVFLKSVSEALNMESLSYKEFIGRLLKNFLNIQRSPQEIEIARCVDAAVAGLSLDDFVPGKWDSIYGKYDDQLEDLLAQMKQEAIITSNLSALKNDDRFSENTANSLEVGINALLFSWKNDSNIQRMVDFYQTDDTFARFREIFFKTDIVKKLETCVKTSYKADLMSLVNDARVRLIHNSIENNSVCDEDVSAILLDVIKKLADNPNTQKVVQDMLLEFINQTLSLEKHLTGSTSYKDYFSDYYNSHYKSSTDTTTNDYTLSIYREGKLIHRAKNPSFTSYIDETVPENTTNRVKAYKYFLTTENECETKKGDVGTAMIDPVLSPNTTIEVYADIKVRVKDGYDFLFADKLSALVEAAKKNNSGTMVGTANQNTSQPQLSCDDAKKALQVTNLNSDQVLNYILACRGNSTVNPIIKEKRLSILPPLMMALKLNKTEENSLIIDHYIEPIITNLMTELWWKDEVFAIVGGELAKINPAKRIFEFTDAEKEIIMCGGIPNCESYVKDKMEHYFSGSSHAIDLMIDSATDAQIPVNKVMGRTNMFGEIDNLYLGQYLSGQGYDLKIRLANEKYVLPKQSSFTLNTAQPQSNGTFKAVLDLNYGRQFRYGNFDENNDIIDLNDILAWGRLIAEDPERWNDSNLDGLYGVDLLDVITFQQNWGEVRESRLEESQISLTELAGIFGFTTKLQSKIQAPAWLSLLELRCDE